MEQRDALTEDVRRLEREARNFRMIVSDSELLL